MVYKLKIYVENEDGTNIFKDFYLRVEMITSFFVPDKAKDDPDDHNTINIFFDGYTATVMQEPHILKYLKENFTDRAVTCIKRK